MARNLTYLPNTTFIGQTTLPETPSSGAPIPRTKSLSDLYRVHKSERKKEKIYTEALRKIEIQEWIDDWADLVIDEVESIFMFDSGPNYNGCNVRFSPQIEVIPPVSWYGIAKRRFEIDLKHLQREVRKADKKKKVRFAKDTFFH